MIVILAGQMQFRGRLYAKTMPSAMLGTQPMSMYTKCLQESKDRVIGAPPTLPLTLTCSGLHSLLPETNNNYNYNKYYY